MAYPIDRRDLLRRGVYTVGSVAALGIRRVSGVPGDYTSAFDDAIESSERLTWVGNAKELNAAYAADGYPRLRGASILR